MLIQIFNKTNKHKGAVERRCASIPVGVSHLQQLAALLRQQADGLCVVLDGLLQDQMFLQQLQGAGFVLKRVLYQLHAISGS